MYKDDTYKETMLFVIERLATNDDSKAHANEHAMFLDETTLAPAEAEPAGPTPEAEGNA
jgi:hypothetical protein